MVLMLIDTCDSLITKDNPTVSLTSMGDHFVVKDNLNNLNIPPFRGGILR